MMRAAILVVGVLLGSAAAPLAMAMTAENQERRAPAPFELSRSLNALQDQIAHGSEAALAAQQGLLLRMGEQMLELDCSLWREAVNARAAIGFVLSGGEPELLRVLLAEDALPVEEAELARAALAYATGRWNDAISGFAEVDARRLPPVLGAHVALVQASLAMSVAPAEALHFLETARLLAPGTLVEEAALRRQLSVESRLSNPESFVSFATHYFRRFPNSLYGANLRHMLPALWTGLGLPSDEESFDQLDLMLGELAPSARRGVYLAFAREHALAADQEFTRHAATRAGELSEQGSTEQHRAKLYAVMAGVAGADLSEARQSLQAIDPALLSAQDAGLHRAALSVLDEVESSATVPNGAEVDDFLVLPLAERARDVIAATDILLRREP